MNCMVFKAVGVKGVGHQWEHLIYIGYLVSARPCMCVGCGAMCIEIATLVPRCFGDRCVDNQPASLSLLE